MKKGLYIFLIAMCVGVAALLIFGNVFNSTDKFAKGSVINGVNVGGLSAKEAEALINSNIEQENDNLNLQLKYGDYVWDYGKENFLIVNNTSDIVNSKINQSLFSRLAYRKLNANVETKIELKDSDNMIEEVISQIEQEAENAEINFDATSPDKFVIKPEKVGKCVDKEKLLLQMKDVFSKDIKAVDIPVVEIQPEITAKQLEKCKKQQSTYTTSYEKSNDERKNNIAIAASRLNGYRVEPGVEFSFNEAIGERTASNGYKEANIILDGKFVKGVGGGVCQASTTLYNALLLSGVEVTEAKKHSLPISYVPLAFDAMVSWGFSDLKFKNTSSLPVFIQAVADGAKLTFNIYGATLEDNQQIKTRAEFIGTIPHPGDKIVVDENGQYSDKIIFKGEYFREKYPQEGYHSKAYLQYFKDGQMVDEKLIRNERYEPQAGIVYEGAEDLPEGMTLPNNTVSIIAPQKGSIKDKAQAETNISVKNPTIFNP